MKKEKDTGICVSCIHTGACVYKKNSNADTPVMECEQFETGQDTAAPEADTANQAQETNAGRAEQSAYKGLCKTCSASGKCAHVKPGQGVLECEEYE